MLTVSDISGLLRLYLSNEITYRAFERRLAVLGEKMDREGTPEAQRLYQQVESLQRSLPELHILERSTGNLFLAFVRES